MRNLVIALAVVSLLAGSSFGLINVKVTADTTTPAVGSTVKIHVWGQGDAAGLFALAGSVNATGTGSATSTAGTGAWASTFSPTFGLTANPGAPGANGGWANFGSQQTNYLSPDANFAKTAFVDLFDYDLVYNGGSVTLTFAGGTVGGYKPAETNKGTAMGSNTAVTLTPEPVTMALLALGGLVVARRRHA